MGCHVKEKRWEGTGEARDVQDQERTECQKSRMSKTTEPTNGWDFKNPPWTNSEKMNCSEIRQGGGRSQSAVT